MDTPKSSKHLQNIVESGVIDRRRLLALALAGPVAIGAAINASPAVLAQGAALPEPPGPRADGTPAPDDQQVLRVLASARFRMDPPTHAAELWQLQLVVFQALTVVDLDGSLIPGVADTWESNADATEWTFALNPNAKFSDGTPITSADVAWTFNWIANPASKSTGPDLLAGRIVGFQDVRDGVATELSGITAPDPQTVVFALDNPTPAFPAMVSQITGSILKGDNVTSGGEEWWRTPVTSGFFKVTEYTPGDQATMTLERNEHWWREPAKIARVEISVVADPQTQLVAYDNGEVEGIACQPAEFAQATKPDGDRASDLFWDKAWATWYFGFYQATEPFNDPAVRKAFAQAVDLAAVSAAGLNGIYPPEPRIIPPGIAGGGEEQWQPVFDPEAAKQTLASSKYGGPDGLPPVTIVVSEAAGATGLGTWGKVATIIQQQLQQNLGVNVELVRQLFETGPQQQDYLKTVQGGAIFRLSVGAAMPDPAYLGNLASSTSSANWAAYSNPDVDAKLAAADAELDPTTRASLYAEIDKIVSEDAYFLAPFRGTSLWFFRPQVRGMAIALGNVWHSLHKMYIATDA